MLRGYVNSSTSDENTAISKSLLWIYLPDFSNYGRMGNIEYIPLAKSNSSIDAYWHQTDACSGFKVSKECPWRFEEMELISFTPIQCING